MKDFVSWLRARTGEDSSYFTEDLVGWIRGPGAPENPDARGGIGGAIDSVKGMFSKTQKPKRDPDYDRTAWCPFCKEKSVVIVIDVWTGRGPIKYWHCRKCHKEWHKDAVRLPEDSGYKTGAVVLPKEGFQQATAEMLNKNRGFWYLDKNADFENGPAIG
jgi:hypothetical protein